MIVVLRRLTIVLAIGLAIFAFAGCSSTSSTASIQTENKTDFVPAKYGKLQVIGTQLCDGQGKPVQLKGMSTMGLQWYGEIVNKAAFTALAKDWQCELIRLALYVGENGYASKPGLKDLVVKGVELAIQEGMYVIIDWHVLNPGNPNDPVYSGAKAFFDDMSKRFGKYPNVLYEIMNEPNGAAMWDNGLKTYAEKMVATIRANDPDNIILIGSGSWSQDVDLASMDPVAGTNLIYTFHFYSGTHGNSLRNKVKFALDKGVAVFCTEWGTSASNGTGGPFLDRADEWLQFLNENKISWVNWSLCNKNETSAAFNTLLQEFTTDKGTITIQKETPLEPEIMGAAGYPIWPVSQLSTSGNYVRAKMKGIPMPAETSAEDTGKQNVAASKEEAKPAEVGFFNGLPWKFEDGTLQGWSLADDTPAKVTLTIATAESKALAFSFGWTLPGATDAWSTAPRISSSWTSLAGKDYKTLSLDFYIEAAAATTGSLQVQPVIQSPEHGYWFQLKPKDIKYSEGKKIGKGLLKYSCSFPLLNGSGAPLNPNAIMRNLLLITIGINTDYKGVIYYDNINFQ